MKTFRDLYPSAYHSVAKARRKAGAFAQACGFGAAEISDIVLAVGEACSNAVEHGHVDQGEFILTCSFENDVFRAEIIDNGRGFEERATGPGIDPSECVGRGRGIAIMRALMDAVSYRRMPTGMTVILEKGLLARRVEETSEERSGLDSGGCRQSG